MQAFEFNSIVEQGSIRVPEKYIGRIPSAVKVIILAEDVPHSVRKKRFTALPLDTRGFTFDREEANAR